MNLLSGFEDLFRISNEREPCTQGVDLCSQLSSLDRFSAIDATITNVEGDLSNEDMDMAIGFVDAEGQGDRDVTYDARLVCPVLLASKCIIFNWKDSVQKDKILNLLGVMTTAAEGVDLSARAEGYTQSHSDSDGDSGGKPFSHLHIVFRDWNFVDTTRDAVLHDILDTETNVSPLDKEGAIVRNKARKDLKAAFGKGKVK